MDEIKVLVVDDHPAFREGLCRVVADTDDIKVVATSGDSEEAVRLAQKLMPDVVVINVVMPKLSGIEAAKKINVSCPNTGILMVSAHTLGAYVLPALRAGAIGYMLKTSPVDDLISAIRSVRAGETVLDPVVTGKVLHLLATMASEDTKGLEVLHNREFDVLKLVAKGMHNMGIAKELRISDHTVHAHLTNIFAKLGVSSRTEAVLRALKEGWLTFDDLP